MLRPLQEIRTRLKAHRQTHGKDLAMWYVLVDPSVDRKGVQGFIIRYAQQLGLPMSSTQDAAMAYRK